MSPFYVDTLGPDPAHHELGTCIADRSRTQLPDTLCMEVVHPHGDISFEAAGIVCTLLGPFSFQGAGRKSRQFVVAPLQIFAAMCHPW